MIHSSSISQLLNEPHQISTADKDNIIELVQAYPYFLPGRYLQAAFSHKVNNHNPNMMSKMTLYKGNSVLFAQFLEQSISVIETPAEEEVTPEVQEEPVVVNETVEEPVNDIVRETPQEEITVSIEEESKPEEKESNEDLIPPVYTEDYFRHQGMEVSNEIPADLDKAEDAANKATDPNTLMVVMSFSEWLTYYKKKKQQEEEEEADQRALKTMWQKQRLAAALEEEDDEIPENVFEMAVNSISKEDALASESLAEVYAKQGRYDQAIEMYKKLSLRKPQKKAYFARKIEEILKEK